MKNTLKLSYLRRAFLISSIFTLLPFLVFSQTILLKGKVQSKATGIPLEFVSIKIAAKNDSSFSTPVYTAITDSAGDFKISINKGDYILSAHLIGYHSSVTGIGAATEQDMIGIMLDADVTTLKEVAVAGRKKMIERKADRIILNVESSGLASVGSVWDAIGKAPGVIITSKDDLFVSGKPVTIYINDRPVKLSTEDVAMYLKNLPAGVAAKVEILQNPPANYDAEGGAIINIVTNRKLATGLTGTASVQYQQSFYTKNANSLNINYGDSKWTVMTGINYNVGTYLSEEEDYANYYEADKTSLWNMDRNKKSRNRAATYFLNADYNINSNSVLGVRFEGLNNSSKAANGVNTDILNINKGRDSSQITQTLNNSYTNFYAVNLNYTIRLDSLGRQIKFNADQVLYRLNSDQQLSSSSYDNLGSVKNKLANQNDAVQRIGITTAQVDYTDHLPKDIVLETGGKFTFIKTENPFLFRDSIQGEFIKNPSRSNVFDYKEYTSALYLSLTKQFGKWTLKAGLRAEDTRTSAYSQTQDSLVKRNYTRLFPTLFAQYVVNDNHQFNFSYGRRISRPDYWRLNPFEFYITPNYYLTGNPFLLPAIPQSYMISYTFKQQYSASLFYNTTKDKFTNITEQLINTKVTRDIQTNIGSSNSLGMDLYVPLQLGKRVELSNYLYVENRQEKSVFREIPFHNSIWRLYDQLNIQYALTRDNRVKLEVSGFYSSPNIQGIFKLKELFDVGASLKYPFKNNRTTLVAAVTDIFYSNVYNIQVNFHDQVNGFRERNDTRSFSLRLTHKFGYQAKQNGNNAEKGNDEELKRLKL